jgi:hypothetical protein
MDLSKNQKILVGILHFLPIAGIICYFIFFFSFFLDMVVTAAHHQPQANPSSFFRGFISIFVILMITILVALAVKIFDIIHLVKSNRNDTGNKVIMWVLLIIFTGSIGELIYYFLEILPGKNQEVQEL